MISVQNLTKKFGATTAVDRISFEIPQGQLVGFLGPNGAGKTTAMRILTGYIPPDDGRATLLGYDISEDSLAVRQRLGYLPENNPLPDDIEVSEYLHFIGTLRGLKDIHQRKKSIKEVVDSCSLGDVIGKKIGELSKGFRQRVGLAQAIVHDPELLILDEPTSGLDPNQVQDVRVLIQNLKSKKTLLISSHILSEVQQTCDRILIIHKGKIVADGSPDALTENMHDLNRLHVEFKGPSDLIQKELEKMARVKRDGKGFIMESPAEDDLRDAVFQLAVKNKWPILNLQQSRLSLEDVFSALTKEK